MEWNLQHPLILKIVRILQKMKPELWWAVPLTCIPHRSPPHSGNVPGVPAEWKGYLCVSAESRCLISFVKTPFHSQLETLKSRKKSVSSAFGTEKKWMSLLLAVTSGSKRRCQPCIISLIRSGVHLTSVEARFSSLSQKRAKVTWHIWMAQQWGDCVKEKKKEKENARPLQGLRAQ